MFNHKLKKLLSSLVLLAVLGSVLVSPWGVNKTEAFLGLPNLSFTLGDIPRLFAKVADFAKDVMLQQVKTQMLRMIQNDLVNWVQGGGRPRFLQNPLKFFENAGDRALGQALARLVQFLPR